MSKDGPKPGSQRASGRKVEADLLPSTPELSPALEAQLWGDVGRRSSALEELAHAKLTSVNDYLKSVDCAPLTPSEFIDLAGHAIRRAIEQQPVNEVLGAILAARAHEVLCGSVGEALQKRSPRAGPEPPDPQVWV